MLTLLKNKLVSKSRRCILSLLTIPIIILSIACEKNEETTQTTLMNSFFTIAGYIKNEEYNKVNDVINNLITNFEHNVSKPYHLDDDYTHTLISKNENEYIEFSFSSDTEEITKESIITPWMIDILKNNKRIVIMPTIENIHKVSLTYYLPYDNLDLMKKIVENENSSFIDAFISVIENNFNQLDDIISMQGLASEFETLLNITPTITTDEDNDTSYLFKDSTNESSSINIAYDGIYTRLSDITISADGLGIQENDIDYDMQNLSTYISQFDKDVYCSREIKVLEELKDLCFYIYNQI